MSSAEPIWCPRCGDEVGPEHRRECDYDGHELPAEEVLFCELCGEREPCATEGCPGRCDG